MTTAQLVQAIYKIAAVVDSAIVGYFLKTGNATEFNWFEFLYTVGIFVTKHLKRLLKKTINS